MSYLDQPSWRLTPGAIRIFFGALAASAVPSLVLTYPNFADARSVFFLGCLSIFTIYLPLMAWRLPHSRRPLLLAILLGVAAAPGPIGLGIAVVMPVAAPMVVLVAAPFGAIGGLVFWLCALWRNPDFAPGEAD